MKRTALVIIILLSCSIAGLAVDTKSHVFGMGVSVGEPSGISFKLWINRKSAFASVLAWQNKDRVYFHLDYLLHNYNVIPKKDLTGEVPFYAGCGFSVENTKDSNLSPVTSYAVRIILGMDYIFDEMPIDVYGELVPTVIFYPDSGAMLATAIGIRYYFE